MVSLGQTCFRLKVKLSLEVNEILLFSSANSVNYSLRFLAVSVICCVKMASPASFTIRQVAPDQPEAATAEPPADSTDKPTRRRTIRDKRLKDKEEKKKSRKPPG